MKCMHVPPQLLLVREDLEERVVAGVGPAERVLRVLQPRHLWHGCMHVLVWYNRYMEGKKSPDKGPRTESEPQKLLASNRILGT